MLVEGLSLITSISNAVGALLISKGMKDSNASSASLISTSIQAVALLVPFMFSIPELNWQALALFALSGAFALGIARLLYFVAMERIGVAVSSAIIGSVRSSSWVASSS
jgi:drug/metabolite transporter (DMT)-like permease